jgi:hypothetical protein
MAGSRLVDHELTKQQEEMEALEHEEAEREQGHNTTTGTATP